jgi:hypothetical protein
MTDVPLPGSDNRASQPLKASSAAPPSPATAAPQAVFDPQLFPPRHRPLRELIMDHNPFLLLSTVCMLLGCYLVSAALHAKTDLKLVGLLAAMNAYEACIIPLGLVLIRRTRGMARDGWWLLLFETLFLVNSTFVSPDFRHGWAIPVNLTLLVLACVKAGMILKGLQIPLRLRTFGFLVVQLAIIYSVPCFLSWVDNYELLLPWVMYGLWWLVGLLPVVYDVMARCEGQQPQYDRVQQVIRRVYVIAPWVMLVAHLGVSHWTHSTGFQAADLTPVLFGLAIASARVKFGPSMRAWVRVVPIVALACSLLSASDEMLWVIHFAGDTHRIVPLHFAIGGTLLTYGYMASVWHFIGSAVVVSVMAAGYVFQGWVIYTCRAAIQLCIGMLPDSTISWGVTAIGAAFVLLGAGAVVSLRRTGSPTLPSRP